VAGPPGPTLGYATATQLRKKAVNSQGKRITSSQNQAVNAPQFWKCRRKIKLPLQSAAREIYSLLRSPFSVPRRSAAVVNTDADAAVSSEIRVKPR